MGLLGMPSKEKVEEIVKKIQSDPELIKKFGESPVKAIEEAGGINIPDMFEPTLESIIKEQIAGAGDKDPMEIINKFMK